MNRFKAVTARTLTSLMVAVTLSATMPLSTALAAPVADKADLISLSSISIEDKEIENVLKAIETYNKSGKKQDLDTVNALIRKLSSQQILKLYTFLSKDFYLKNYLTKGFTFFDVDKYIAKNPDVKKNALLQNFTDIRQYALYHYLTFGIYEGRKSETSFDPVRAILHSPEILTHYVQTKEEKNEDIDLFEDEEYLSEGDLPKHIREQYVKETGKTTTEDLDEKGKVVPDKQPASKDDDTSDSSEETVPKKDEGEEVPDNEYDIYREPVFRNNDSKLITPYTLYDPELKSKSIQFTINNSGTYPAGTNNVTVNFNGENVALAQELSAGKAFTLLQYMCGTDLEGGSRAVSNEISTMLQAVSNNLNIVLFLGGTNNYGAPYFNNSLSGLKAGIYYLNPSALSPEVKEKLTTIDFIGKTQVVTDILEGKTADTENLCKGLKYEDIINENTLISLASISEIDMADPSLLSGFINFGTELFPADNYGLTLSNHGGGYEGGIIFTDQLEKNGNVVINSNNFGPDNLESALASTNLFRDKSVSEDGRLSFLFYDACLMATLEQAYNMRDYSRYMIGSEEIGLGTTDYRAIVNNLNNTLEEKGSDRAISISVSEAAANQRGHGGGKDGLIGPSAAFSLDALDDTITKINALSKDFSFVLGDNGCSDAFKNDVFKAIRKSAISSYKNGNEGDSGTDFNIMLRLIRAIDMGDFYNYLKINLSSVTAKSEQYSASDKETLEKLSTELNAVLDSGFLVYLSVKTFEGFGGVSKKDTEGIIPLGYTISSDKNLWTDIRNADASQKVYPYGVSMAFPLGIGSGSYKSQYTFNVFKGKGMEDYCQFVADFLKFNENPEGYEKQKKALAKEMSSNNIYSKLITQQEGSTGYTTTITDENNNTYTYISFKIADSYEEAGLTPPANSTGSPILDIIDTQPGIWLTSVHKEYFNYEDSSAGDGRLAVNMICAEKRIKHYSINAGNSTIYFDVSATNASITDAYALYGKPYDALTKQTGNKEDWQFVLLSSLESDKDEKKKALALLSSDESYVNSTLSFRGSVLKEDNTGCADAYHFFNNDNGNFTYLGSVLKGENEYSNVSDGVAISAYHYVLREEKNGEEIVRTYKEVLEGHDGFCDGYYSLKDKTQIGLRCVNVTEYDPNTYSYTGLSTAYALDIGGKGTDYSQIAYVDTPNTYEGGDNTGNGQLYVIDMNIADPDFVDSIGVRITNDTINDGDTENPSIHIEEEKPFVKGSESAEADTTEPATAEPDASESNAAEFAENSVDEVPDGAATIETTNETASEVASGEPSAEIAAAENSDEKTEDTSIESTSEAVPVEILAKAVQESTTEATLEQTTEILAVTSSEAAPVETQVESIPAEASEPATEETINDSIDEAPSAEVTESVQDTPSIAESETIPDTSSATESESVPGEITEN